MTGYVQRYPFAPKATWWKRYTDKLSLGKRIIYKVNNSIGFEIDGYPQKFVQRKLYDGQLHTDEEIEFVEIATTEDNSIKPTTIIQLAESFYIYNSIMNEMEKVDVIDNQAKIITAEIPNVIRIEKNIYLKKYDFDCIEVGETSQSENSPLSGMKTEEQRKVLKTHNFQNESLEKSLQPDDLIVYENKLYIIDEILWHYLYSPKKCRVLEFSMVKVR